MALLDRVREKHIGLMGKTLDTLANILQTESEERLQTLRDGEAGWTVTEILCHLRDFDEIFYQRAVRIVSEDNPQLQPVNYEALVIERQYNQQHPHEVYETLRQSRQQFIAFFKALTAEQWERAGVHPAYGEWTLTDAVMQVGHHDANHIEQITRVLNS